MSQPKLDCLLIENLADLDAAVTRADELGLAVEGAFNEQIKVTPKHPLSTVTPRAGPRDRRSAWSGPGGY
jgi:hypothetical protein